MKKNEIIEGVGIGYQETARRPSRNMPPLSSFTIGKIIGRTGRVSALKPKSNGELRLCRM